MKKLVIIFTLLSNLIIFGCNSSRKSDEVATYSYQEEKVEMSDAFKAKIPEWVEEGTVCYGLMIQISTDSLPVRGRPIKAKVVQVNKNSVKMKALESVKMEEIKTCSKYLVTKGEVWDEEEGDFYLTEQEAIQALKKMNLYNNVAKASVD
ncbi:hypothetical protein [uncultured Draconibacterium sp.]|uniref:hypothetical protein n=1 Tax=uncultured Draconibacterium sp. TaxID=1573823 RepID=UPI002AA8533E|nr:hypothetical protein [uncultured Draconibacterium sp.]